MRTDSWTDPIPIANMGGAWVFPEQAVLYTESTQAVPEPEDAHALIDFFLWLADHIQTPRAPTVIHDWRSLRSVPRDVRKVFIQRRKQIPQQPERVVIAVTMNPLVRMTVRTVSLAAQLLVRTVDLDLVEDTAPTLRALGVTTPDPNLHARLRVAWKHAR